jgi:4-hydroxybenzoate polyprenyltransferase
MTTISQTQKSFINRIWTYSLEMFPVLIYLPYVIALYVCLNFTTQAVSSGTIVLDIYGIVGMITAFFMMLQMRTFDDLKDFEIDKDLFPDRATPRGAVLKKDIQIISLTSFVILVATNIMLGQKTIVIFAIMIVYALLTYKWFFAEKFHREHVFFTMLTHQPLPVMINFFLIHTALASGAEYSSFTMNHFILLLIFSLPVTAWETSRKIRSADMETNYETFSILFGARGATLIPFSCLLLAGSFAIYTGNFLDLNNSYFAIVALLLTYVIVLYGRFLIWPTNKNNVLKNVAMVFTTCLFLNLLIHILMISPVSVNL